MIAKDNPEKTSYQPVSWEFREVILQEIDKETRGKVFFFNEAGQVSEAEGRAVEMLDEKKHGVFVLLDTDIKIRLDQIITLFGKIGDAYDRYDAYGNSCMDCLGGYEKDEL